MVDKLRTENVITSEELEEAFRKVPRERFVPVGIPLEDAYNADDSVVTKTDADGGALSSVSAPFVQARMIEQAELKPGMRVLEIGSGGYNAALLSEIVGKEGHVVSVDIDAEITDRASAALDATGYGNRVTVVQADAEHGAPELAPFDAIIVTVGAWDIPPAWLKQLTEDGRLVVPLRMNGITRSLGFRREDEHLVSTSAAVCGFVPMQGEGASPEHVLRASDAHGRDLQLRFDNWMPNDPNLLDGVLDAERTTVWSGVTIERHISFADLHLWFACFLPGFCKPSPAEGIDLAAEPERWFPFAAVRGESFAYLVVRPAPAGTATEFGARAIGPGGEAAATAMVEQIRAWDRNARRGPGPTFAFWPARGGRTHLPSDAVVLDKTHGTVTISWPTITDTAASLRTAMVDELRDQGAIRSEPVAGAVSAVPRHLFAVGEPLEEAYAANKPLTVKRDETGAALSSLSAAHLQAVMLEQAEIEPGMSVLEIGSGGYNAALIRQIVGDSGKVVSVDIDPEIVDRARTCLNVAGYGGVEVVLADADTGFPESGPYDRIIVTAGAWDIPPAWIEQLAPRGRLVVPLRMKGLTRSIAFERDGDALVSRSYGLCSFVPMQGAGSHNERTAQLGEGVVLRADDAPPQFDVEALREAIRGPRIERWSGAAYDLPDELELFLITSSPQVVLLYASDALIGQGVFAASAARGVPVLISGDSLAYRTRRPNEETGGFESGVIAHGPQADAVAARYVDLLRRWANTHRRRGAARIQYLPTATRKDESSPGLMHKRHGSVAVVWS